MTPLCLLVLIQVNQQGEHFALRIPVDKTGNCMVWELSRTNEIKAGQWASSSRLGSFDTLGYTAGNGIYQEDMNEVAWAATKATCEK